MTPQARRIVIPLLVLGVALGVLASVVLNNRSKTSGSTAPAPTSQATGASGAAPEASGGAGTETPSSEPGAPEQATADSAPRGSAGTDTSDLPAAQALSATVDIATWQAVAPTEGAIDPVPPIGSFDPSRDRMKLELTNVGAGITRIAFSDFWQTAAAKRQARRHYAAPPGPDAPPLPPESLRFVLTTETPLGGFVVPVLAVHSIEVNGTRIQLFSNAWSCTAPGVFVSEVRNAEGAVMLRLHRHYRLGENAYDVTLLQSVENLSGVPLEVRWVQYGPGDLPVDRARYIDIRRFHFGYLASPSRDPSQSIVLTDGQMVNTSKVVSQVEDGDDMLWPNPASKQGGFTLSWMGSTNRYFALAAHPAWAGTGPVPLVLKPVQDIRANMGDVTPVQQQLFTEFFSPAQSIAPGETGRFDLGVFAGPLDPKILEHQEPYRSLRLSGLIVYLISDCCASCTFGWLANLLLSFLSFLHDYVVFDWGLAIIVLVLIVRALLHPIMKRSQVQMQRVTRAMAELKPEMEKLQARYKSDPAKLQQEQMRLYREKGVNPVGCLAGLLPTLLQTPIWIALYAMLYFAFEIWQQPAFFGVFQLFWGWPFLADLSVGDHFFWEFEQPHRILFFTLTGINLLPILMGVVFYFQQRYMTPPPTTTLTPEQQQQQKMMKVMMVVLFPVMLYPAPSGLTLYILTSSLVGIIEGRQIRKHIEKQDKEPPSPKKKMRQDRLGKMYEAALKRAEERAAAKRQPKRRFKER